MPADFHSKPTRLGTVPVAAVFKELRYVRQLPTPGGGTHLACDRDNEVFVSIDVHRPQQHPDLRSIVGEGKQERLFLVATPLDPSWLWREPGGSTTSYFTVAVWEGGGDLALVTMGDNTYPGCEWFALVPWQELTAACRLANPYAPKEA